MAEYRAQPKACMNDISGGLRGTGGGVGDLSFVSSSSDEGESDSICFMKSSGSVSKKSAQRVKRSFSKCNLISCFSRFLISFLFFYVFFPFLLKKFFGRIEEKVEEEGVDQDNDFDEVEVEGVHLVEAQRVHQL